MAINPDHKRYKANLLDYGNFEVTLVINVVAPCFNNDVIFTTLFLIYCILNILIKEGINKFTLLIKEKAELYFSKLFHILKLCIRLLFFSFSPVSVFFMFVNFQTFFAVCLRLGTLCERKTVCLKAVFWEWCLIIHHHSRYPSLSLHTIVSWYPAFYYLKCNGERIINVCIINMREKWYNIGKVSIQM